MMKLLRSMRKPTRYAILATPRTGSNVLCDLLASTGLAGIASVYSAGFFIGSGEGTAQAYRDGAVETYFETARTLNGVEGCKLMFDYLDHLDLFLPPGATQHLLDSFERFVYLTRVDVVAQAVSRLFAKQSTIWQSEDARTREARPVQYDREMIARFIEMARADNARIEAFFEERQVTPLRMTYEENARDWGAAVRRVLKFIGVSVPEPLPLVHTLQKQDDPHKAEFIRLFQGGSHHE